MTEIKYGTMLEVAQECASQLGRIADALSGANDARIDALDRRLEETLKLFAEKDRKQRAVNVALRNLLCTEPVMWTESAAAVLREEFFKAVTKALKP